jgi:hypothetical protein
VTTPQSQDNKHWLFVGKFVNGFVYWMYAEEACMLLLNTTTTTLHFSQMDLPLYLKGQTHMYMVGKDQGRRALLQLNSNFMFGSGMSVVRNEQLSFKIHRGQRSIHIHAWVICKELLILQEIGK